MRLVTCLSLALLLIGCGDGPLTPTTINMSGTWQGPITNGDERQTLRLSLFQRNEEISGTWVIGSTGGNGGSLGGQVSGDTAILTLREEATSSCVLNITATVTESRMTGSYSISGCGASLAGSVNLTKL